MTHPLITFTSDFGARDEYVGSVKGVLLGVCPGATIVDLTHEIGPQAVHEAAWLLKAASAAFPDGAIHLAVVDPGVGSRRRALAARTRRAFWVGPDNGLFSWVFEQEQPAIVVEIDRGRFFQPPAAMRPPAPSGGQVDHALQGTTFDGRDLFAPVAARLACGSPLESFGRPINDWVRLTLPAPTVNRRANRLAGEIIRVDRFGNLISNITTDHLVPWLGSSTCPPEGAGGRWSIRLGKRSLPLYRSYTDARRGAAGALINSSGHLEIFSAGGSACRALRAGAGSPVTMTYAGAKGKK